MFCTLWKRDLHCCVYFPLYLIYSNVQKGPLWGKKASQNLKKNISPSFCWFLENFAILQFLIENRYRHRGWCSWKALMSSLLSSIQNSGALNIRYSKRQVKYCDFLPHNLTPKKLLYTILYTLLYTVVYTILYTILYCILYTILYTIHTKKRMKSLFLAHQRHIFENKTMTYQTNVDLFLAPPRHIFIVVVVVVVVVLVVVAVVVVVVVVRSTFTSILYQKLVMSVRSVRLVRLSVRVFKLL